MFKNLRPAPCHDAPAEAVFSETRLIFGCGIAAGLWAAPAISNGRSSTTGLRYRAAAQFRATPGNIPPSHIRGIQS